MTTETCKCDPELSISEHIKTCPELPIYCTTCYMGSAASAGVDCPCCGNRGHRQADKVECVA